MNTHMHTQTDRQTHALSHIHTNTPHIHMLMLEGLE